MSDSSRLDLIDRSAAIPVGAPMTDLLGLYAVLLLAALEGARAGTDVSEPPSFSRLRGDLRQLIKLVEWDDIAFTIAVGRSQVGRPQ